MDRDRVRTEVAGVIDHTLLKPDAVSDDIRKLCGEARGHGFASVCVNPSFVPLAAELLRGSSVRVCTVVGFPLGAHRSETKAYEAELAVRQGAREVDMVVDIGALKGGDIGAVERDVAAVVAAARGVAKDAAVKVIVETCLLTDREKEEACRAIRRAGADFVKTSTGFSAGGATIEDVALLKKAGEGLLVKASGGIRTWADFRAMRRAGADRIGTSGGVRIVAEALASEEE